jgi:hypothetical protein
VGCETEDRKGACHTCIVVFIEEGRSAVELTRNMIHSTLYRSSMASCKPAGLDVFQSRQELG